MSTTITHFLEPTQGEQVWTNEVVCKTLSELTGNNSDFSAGTDIVQARAEQCKDGRPHTFYRVEDRTLRIFWLNRGNLHIDFQIWQRRGEGKYRKVTGSPLFPRTKPNRKRKGSKR